MLSPIELLGRDRIWSVMERNESLNQAMAGLNETLADLCMEYRWIPEGLRFQTPHLNGRGLFDFRFEPTRRGYCRLPNPWELGDGIRDWMHAEVHLTGEFLHRCRSWRTMLEEFYAKAEAFGFAHGVRFEDLRFASPRIREDGRGWLTVSLTTDADLAVQAQGTGRPA
jgi:hypothetical protein